MMMTLLSLEAMNLSFKLSLIHRLNKHFALKDLGDLSYFLGIQVNKSSSSIHLS